MNLIIVGKPGAGKGSVAEVFKQKGAIIHLSTGDIFRKEMKEHTTLGELALSYIGKGQLVPDSVTNDIIYKILEKNPSGSYLFDGYPRTVNQAECLEQMMEKLNMKLDLVCDLKVTDDLVIFRLSGRRVCKSCGTIYHVINHPPKKDSICDVCGGEVIQRADDKEEAIKARLNVYQNQTKPLVDYYKAKGLLRSVDGDQSALDVYLDIMEILDNEKGR